MSKPKHAEGEFKTMMTLYRVWIHKWQDVRNCPHCHRAIFMTDRSEGEKDEASIVDYQLIIDLKVHWVEVKGKPDRHRLPFKEFAKKQVNFLDSWSKAYAPCWVFVSLGTGRIPNRKAWLIWWETFRNVAKDCKKEGMKSIPWQETGRLADVYNMTDVFEKYELIWRAGTGWIFPDNHPMLNYLEGHIPVY